MTDRAAQIGELLAQLTTLLASEDAAPATAQREMPPRVLLTVAEAAERLRIGRTTAYALVRNGDLESVRIGRLRRIHVDAVAAYAGRLANQSHAA